MACCQRRHHATREPQERDSISVDDRGTARIHPVDPITIMDDESRRGVPRPCLAELLRGPRRGRMRRDIQVDDAAAGVRQYDEHKQNAEGGGRNREEVDRGELGDVIGEDGTPRLRRRTTGTPEVLRHCGLRDLDSEFLSLAVNAWRSPEWVRFPHLANQRTETGC